MLELPGNIAELIAAEKEIAIRPKWDVESDPEYARLSVPLVIGEVAVGGLELIGRASQRAADRAAMFQLQYFQTGRHRIPLWRCQWRPFETHTNPGWGPPGLAFAEFCGTSHNHAFADNFLESELRMRSGNLPAARPISPDPSTLSGFIDFCGECFKIKNIGIIEAPQISPDMFWTKDD